MLVPLFFLIVCQFSSIYANYKSPCEEYKSCSECIRSAYNCKWCSMDNYNGTYRCRLSNDTMDCDPQFIENPQNNIVILKDINFNSESGDVVQIKPQQYSIQMRPGSSVAFNFSFKGADNYPVDLYFLIDASESMDNVIKTVANASKGIYEELTNKTNNVFLGMGTFIDKNALPFVYKVNKSQTYSFRHQLKLTNDSETLKEIMSHLTLGTNRDPPEGGFDALAQVMACKYKIGWRNESRKIIIFMTDDQSHSAGDGKWAGIVRPYDGGCYLDDDGYYTKELEMDYPSLGIINKLASDNEIIIIFIVVEDKKDYYQALFSTRAKYIRFKNEGKVVFNQAYKKGLKTALTEIYEEIRQDISFKINIKDQTTKDKKNIALSLSPCGLSNKCKAVQGQELNFQASLSLKEYYGRDTIPIEITVEGIVREKLQLTVDVIKDCDCETNLSKIRNDSEFCHHGGVRKCGICECFENRYGRNCMCTKNTRSVDNAITSCRENGSTELCSGRGACECGTCKCLPGFEGKFCECNENSCPLRCNGHGKCMCGKCLCQVGWTGATCECSETSCEVNNGKMCNNRGKCVCGECECDNLAAWDARLTQDPECVVLPRPESQSKQCQLLEPCAICHLSGTPTCSECDRLIDVNVTGELDINQQNVVSCENVKVDILCYTRYTYRYKENKYGIELFLQTKKNCVQNYYLYGGIFLATLVLGGVGALILWKMLVDARDRREYDRFVKAHAGDMEGPTCNPIYTPAVGTYDNPAFRKRSINRY